MSFFRPSTPADPRKRWGGWQALPASLGHESRSLRFGTWFWAIVAAGAGFLGICESVLPGGSVAAGLGPIAWTLLVAVSGYVAFSLSQWFAGGRSLILRLIIAGLLVQAIPSLLVTYLGFFGVLSSGTLLVSCGLVGGGCVLIRAWLGGPRQSESSLIRSQLLGHPGKPGFLPGVAVGLMLLTGGLILLKQVLYVSSDADSTFYHLPMVAEWCRTGSIWSVERIKPIAQAYPGFKEALLTAMTLPVGNEHLAVPGGLEYALFVLVAYGLMRRFRVPRAPAVAGVAYLATMPVMAAAGVKEANTDIPLATTIGASVLFLAMYVRRPSGRVAVLAGAALGILAAIKFSGVVYVAILLCVAVLHGVLARHRSPAVGARGRLVHAGLGVAVVMLIAGPWYVRNVILFGNPLYPAEVSLAGHVLFAGPLGSGYFAPLTLGWDVGPLFANPSHFDAAFGWLVPAIVLGTIAFAIRALLRPGELRRGLPLLILPVLLAVAFLHHPYNRPSFHYYYNMRYLLGVVLIGFCTAMACVPRTVRTQRVLAWILVLFAVANLAMWTHHVYWIAAAASLVGLWRVVRSGEPDRHRPTPVLRWTHAGGVVALALCAFLLQPMRASLQYDPDYGYRSLVTQPSWGRICSHVHEHVRGSRIAVCGDHMLFPLYGDDLSNTVYAMHGKPTEEAVLSFCDEHAVDYVVVYRPVIARVAEDQVVLGDSLGRRLAAQHSSRFSVELEHDGAYVLRVNVPLRSAWVPEQ